jgi:EAL domain-containing protein (putative c-di-GMP-specific phosphodiesterase class I)
MIGEMSLLDQLPRSASAKARIETRLRVLTRQHLDDKLEEGDPLLRLLLNMILKRYRAATSGGKAADDDQKDREAVLKRLRLEQELEAALERREFVLYYQPIVDLNTYAVAGFEALIRWVSPTRGFVSPGEFMPVVEDSDLIHGVGKWVLEEGCAAMKRMSLLQRPIQSEPLFMSINLSGRQLEAPDLIDIVGGAIHGAGIDPARIKLEVTESLLMKDMNAAVAVLQRCRALGAKIAMDDFGTGYSSLNYIYRFPINTLKIDRSFVVPMLKEAGASKMVESIGGMAHSLGMNIVAEGMEEADQAIALHDLKVEYGQGYLFSKPVDEKQASAMLTAEWPWKFERRRGGRRVVERRA